MTVQGPVKKQPPDGTSHRGFDNHNDIGTSRLQHADSVYN